MYIAPSYLIIARQTRENSSVRRLFLLATKHTHDIQKARRRVESETGTFGSYLVAYAVICLDSDQRSHRHVYWIVTLSLIVVFASWLSRTRVNPGGNEGSSFEVVDLAGRGKGLVATRDIKVYCERSCSAPKALTGV